MKGWNIPRYQDLWKNPVEERSILKRWELLAPIFARYARTFSFFDISETSGYFSLRATDDFGAVSVVLNRRTGTIEDISLEQAKTICCLRTLLYSNDIAQIAKTEHFDVIFVSSFGDDWRLVVDSALVMGDLVLMEYDPYSELGIHLQQLEPQVLGTADGNVIGLFSKLEFDGLHQHWMSGVAFRMGRAKNSGIEITTSYTSKMVSKEETVRPWVHGINLNTFLSLNGAYPSRKMIIRMIMASGLPENEHGDIQPWNYILDGKRVHLIDFDGTKRIDDTLGVIETIRAVHELPQPMLL